MDAPEERLAATVVAWVQALGWEVYQEVQVGRRARADIVAREPAAPRRLWVIECKTRAGLGVIAQASRWLGRAHLVSVAVPRGRAGLFEEVLAWKGVGGLRVGPRGVVEVVAPRLLRRPRAQPLVAALRPEQQRLGRAGSARGGHYTPFRATCLALAEAVRRRPGVTLREALVDLPTHYRTPAVARASLARWLREGVVPGVRAAPDPTRARRVLLYPAA